MLSINNHLLIALSQRIKKAPQDDFGKLVASMILLRLLLAFTPALAVRNDDLRIVQGADSVIANYPYQVSTKFPVLARSVLLVFSSSWRQAGPFAAPPSSHQPGHSARHLALSKYIKSRRNGSKPLLFPSGALPVTVRAGSSSWSSGGTLHNGYAVHVHPQYQPGSNDYNYALIFVYPEFPIGTPGYEAVVVPKFEALPGMILSASGWGSTRVSNLISNKKPQLIRVFSVQHNHPVRNFEICKLQHHD